MWFKSVVIITSLIAVWQIIVWITGAPPFIVPAPLAVATALIGNLGLIGFHATVTIFEIIAGLLLGCTIGIGSAWLILQFQPVRTWFLPILVASQALPVFAIAPVLMLWLGFGMPSKIAMATLIIYFPVTAALYDGLRNTDSGWIDMARIMGASKHTVAKFIRLPAALPSLGSGLRIAAAVAPIGAVVGEWVGSSSGLGYLMLHANARSQIDLMFAALIVLAAFAVLLYFGIDSLIKKTIFWQTETTLEAH
ncbi:MAG: ABC transporter permease [Acidiferrobacterales bacterium]|nr:ABC transporter permease [Acidiferrobacterales bacterium]